jgi:glycosyltransferase A (GT-A) superfamily protein (DUF2064 family)
MNRPTSDLPEPLLAAGATDFERSILDAGANEDPSQEATKRMAAALGLSAGVAAVATSTTLASAAGAKTVAGATSTALWPWVSIGVLGALVSGAVVETRHWRGVGRDLGTRSAPAAVVAPPAVTVPTVPEAATAKPIPGEATSMERILPARPQTTTEDLREQIALVDAARAALKADTERTLQTVRRYEDRFPTGAFRPEAAALRIEALVALGRQEEARALAKTFVAENRGTALADRVARIAGVSKR